MIVKNILANYGSNSPGMVNAGVIAKLARILNAGKLSGTGRLIVLPVDQGFEHGPDISFLSNPPAYDPVYHIKLAIEAGLSAFAAPLGMLECVADYIEQIPCILKINSSNSINPSIREPNQAMTGSVEDAIRLGCSAVGMTIYPGSGNFDNMLERAGDVVREARNKGLPTVIWSYPRGNELGKDKETALDIVGYATYIAAAIGAHIIKVKVPTVTHDTTLYDSMDVSTVELRVKQVMRTAFAGKRLVVFSGGIKKNHDDLLKEISGIKAGGGSGSIIGRNVFQRPRQEALRLLKDIIEIYKN